MHYAVINRGNKGELRGVYGVLANASHHNKAAASNQTSTRGKAAGTFKKQTKKRNENELQMQKACHVWQRLKRFKVS